MHAPREPDAFPDADDPLSGFFGPYQRAEGRAIQLLMDAVNKCNLRCVMCHFAFPETRATKYVAWSDEVRHAVEELILPITEHVVLSVGTEPLMWKDFVDFLSAVKRKGVPTFEMITNGTLMTPEHAAAIVDSGMTKVQLSLESLEPESFAEIRAGATFDLLLRALRLLNEAKSARGVAKPALQLNFTVMRRNVHELEDLVRFASEHGVEAVDVRHLVVIPGLDMERESLTLDKRRFNESMDRAQELADELGVEICTRPANFDLAASDRRSSSAPPRAETVDDDASTSERPATPEAASPAPHSEPRAGRDEAPRVEPEALLRPAPPRGESVSSERLPAAVRARAEDEGLPLPARLPVRPYCEVPWRQVNVRPEGFVVPCCFWYSGRPMGRLGWHEPREIWQGPEYRRLRWEILTGNLSEDCRNCPSPGVQDVDADDACRAHRSLALEERAQSEDPA